MTEDIQKPSPLAPDAAFAGIRLLCCDVDGVLTDGGLYYGPEGPLFTRFNVLDGQGLKSAQDAGISTCFVTKSHSAMIARRASDLGVTYCLMGVEDKVAAVTNILNESGLGWGDVAHIADDINDLGLLAQVKVAVSVPNAVPEVLRACRFVTNRSGGEGAVRELCDVLLQSR